MERSAELVRMRRPSQSILAYLRAKDGNRPHILAQAFTHDASLVMDVKTETISFPPVSSGRAAIAEVLVRQFARTYENVYTLCLCVPPTSEERAFACDWLVVMSCKDAGTVRVGCGRYDWDFAPDSRLVERLKITIQTMQSLPPHTLDCMMAWVGKLPYPWCPADLAMQLAPDLPELHPIRRYVMRNGA